MVKPMPLKSKKEKAPITAADLQGRLAFKPEEAAVLLGLNQFTIYRLLNRGLLKSAGGLRHKLIPQTEIQRYLRDTMS